MTDSAGRYITHACVLSALVIGTGRSVPGARRDARRRGWKEWRDGGRVYQAGEVWFTHAMATCPWARRTQSGLWVYKRVGRTRQDQADLEAARGGRKYFVLRDRDRGLFLGTGDKIDALLLQDAQRFTTWAQAETASWSLRITYCDIEEYPFA